MSLIKRADEIVGSSLGFFGITRTAPPEKPKEEAKKKKGKRK